MSALSKPLTQYLYMNHEWEQDLYLMLLSSTVVAQVQVQQFSSSSRPENESAVRKLSTRSEAASGYASEGASALYSLVSRLLLPGKLSAVRVSSLVSSVLLYKSVSGSQ